LDPNVRLKVIVGCLLALALGAGGAFAGASGAATGNGPTYLRFADSTLGPVARSSAAAASPFDGTSGGVYTTASGAGVRVYSDTSYTAQDPSYNQRWADFLASAPHGAELSRVTVVLLPLDQVQALCGASSLACYSPDSELIVAPGSDPAPDVPATDVLLHEYGHHIAENRDNDPWPAVDYGPKRWASDKNICQQTANGMLHPGDEAADYRLNPGEAWAETYRVYAERTLGLTVVPWMIVSSSFYPDDAALAAAADDVHDPWMGNATASGSGRFAAKQKARRLSIGTPYDGGLSIGLRNRTKSALKLKLVSKTGAPLATGSVAAGKTKTLRASVCGQRLLQLEISRTKTGAGTYSTTISKP